MNWKGVNMVTIQRGYARPCIELLEVERFEKVIAKPRLIFLKILHPKRGIERPKIGFDELASPKTTRATHHNAGALNHGSIVRSNLPSGCDYGIGTWLALGGRQIETSLECDHFSKRLSSPVRVSQVGGFRGLNRKGCT